ncbi:MAG TPA: NAD(P)-binding domain-containing protein [Lentzea sp.]
MNTTSTSATVAVIGLGNLGRALAEAFLRDGHPTTVWNRSAAKATELVERGATAQGTVGEAVAAGELVVVAVLNHEAALEVLSGVDVRGRALVNLTSGSPNQARELARWAESNGAEYLHGAVYAVPQTIGTEQSGVLYSGSSAVHERWRNVLALLGRVTFVGADPGRASGYDVAILAAMYGLLGGFLHGAAVAKAEGIAVGDLTPLMSSWLTDLQPALVTFAEEIDSGEYGTDESSLAMNQSGLGTLIEASESVGVPAAVLGPLKELVDRQVADGHGALSLARAVESFASPAGAR